MNRRVSLHCFNKVRISITTFQSSDFLFNTFPSVFVCVVFSANEFLVNIRPYDSTYPACWKVGSSDGYNSLSVNDQMIVKKLSLSNKRTDF